MRRHIPSALLLIALIAIWHWASTNFGLSKLVLPEPTLVAAAWWRGWQTGYFWPHLWQTLQEVLLGLMGGTLLGLCGGLLLAEVPLLRRLAMPYVVVSQVVPKLALAPLFMVWFGLGMASTVVIVALICFFPLLESTLTAVTKVDAQRLDLFRMLGASRWQTLWRLKIPAGLPAILAGWRVAVVLALVGAVVGEFIGANQGLGAVIIASQGMMDTALMFAALINITGLGLALYFLTLLLEKQLLQHHPHL
jgi:NitT/TauT family transport system permease protein